MKNINIKQIRKILILMVISITTYEICGGVNIYNLQINKGDIVYASQNTDLTLEKIDTRTTIEKINELNTEIDEQLKIYEELQARHEAFMAPKEPIKPIQIGVTHKEDCLEEGCEVLECLVNVSNDLDYNYYDTSAIGYDYNGNPIYGQDAVRNANMSAEEFISMIAPLAEAAQEKFGIPASTIIAQAGLETGWGDHIIGNNLFGIKATESYIGPTVSVGTTEYNNSDGYSTIATFRGYNSIGEAVYDYARNVIKSNPHMYAGVVTDNWIDSVYGLGPYATDPNYFNLVIQVINDFNLTQFNM